MFYFLCFCLLLKDPPLRSCISVLHTLLMISPAVELFVLLVLIDQNEQILVCSDVEVKIIVFYYFIQLFGLDMLGNIQVTLY